MSTDIRLETTTLDGARIAYSSVTEFLVQTGRGSRAYKTERVFIGDLAGAAAFYRSLKIAPGQKKRLLMPASRNPVIAKAVLY